MFQNTLRIFVVLFLGLSTSSAFANAYLVKKSEIRYEIDHLLKKAHGTSNAAKGKIVCAKTDAQCEFLFAIATGTFESGNSNRDSHMKETVKEAAHPMATLRGQISNLLSPKPLPSTSLDFAGKAVNYPLSELTVRKSGHALSIHAKFILDLTAHEIERPSLLGASIKNEVPVEVQLEMEEQD